MAISIGRLSGGNTPADGSDPRTFPAIWNATADTLEGLSNTVEGLEVGDLADATVTSPSFGQPLTYDPVSDRWVNDSGNYPVMVFADDDARSSAIPSPSEGMVTYVEDNNRVEVYDGASFGPIGGILQVVQTVKTNIFTSNSTTFTEITGLSVTITPSSASSKVLILAQVSYGLTVNTGSGIFRLSGGNTSGYVGDSSGSRTQAIFGGFNHADNQSNIIVANATFLDSPATTSATTYQLEVMRGSGGSGSININRSQRDTDDNAHVRGASSITVMEVAV